MRRLRRSTTALAGLCSVLAAPALAQNEGWRANYTLYGTPGLIEMPSGQSPVDAEIAFTAGGFDLQQRYTLSFQLTERLGGSFRYSRFDRFRGEDTGETYDRSFDFHYRLLNEGRYVPSTVVGLRDFLGTGRYTGEYIAATKTLTPNLRVTGGLGWGRLGTESSFTNPLGVLSEELETRPAYDFGEGGTIADDQFFRGDAALFGGVEYRFSESLTAVAEYSSDAYADEQGYGTFDNESPMNYGLRYSPVEGIDLTLAYLKGSELAFGGTMVFNPKERATYSGLDKAPLPVRVRSADARAAQTWNRSSVSEEGIRKVVAEALEEDGMRLVAMEIGDQRARVRFANSRYRSDAQAIGRVSRVLTQAMPGSVEFFELEVVREGLPLSQVTLSRTDLERLENEIGASALSYDRAIFEEAGTEAGLTPVPNEAPRFQWGVGPYFGFVLFNSDEPVAIETGIEAEASYRLAPNLLLEGAVRKRLTGEIGEVEPIQDPPIPVVRRDGERYFEEGDPALQKLTLTHYGRPAASVYSRLTVGYLEEMFGGVSGEVLWRPVSSRTAVGGELNYVAKRDYDQGFGFQDYDVVTGHASLYQDFGNEFLGQLDVGRYLAGDWGATVSLSREFDNGWQVGAYATKTDVSAEDFGEGSFDKGLRVTIPIDYIIGSPTRTEADQTISSLTRDGGARLEVDGRLYDVTRDARQSELEDGWGRFWR